MGTTEEIRTLVLDACDLVDRYRHLAVADERVEREVEALRAEICAALGTCFDVDAADDGHGAVAELDDLLIRLAALPARQVALSA